jgi:hypothetical protein
MYGQSSDSRAVAFNILYLLHELPQLRHELKRLGVEGGVMVHVAQKLRNL